MERIITCGAIRQRGATDRAALLAGQRFVVLVLAYPAALDPASVERLCAYLSRDEQARAAQMPMPAKRAEFVLSRALLRRTLGMLLDSAPPELDLATTAAGKPLLRHPAASIAFNLSHTSGYILLALSQSGQIGVDIETLGDYQERIARRFFHPAEYAWLEQLEPARRAHGFYHLWTVKEACIKAIGAGLRFPLRKLPVSDARAGVCLGLSWQVLTVDPAVRAAVALRPRRGQPVADAWRQQRISLAALLHPEPAAIKEELER